MSDILDACRSGAMQLWLVSNGAHFVAACITQISKYPAKLYLTVTLAGGSEVHTWLENYITAIRRFAKDNQCEGIEIYGRKGWARILDKHSFTSGEGIMMELAI